MSFRVFSTFTSIGGFELGIMNATDQPIEVIGYSEIDKYASSVYEHHFKGVKNYGDITKIKAEKLPDFDCLVGGFPCQAFSLAGRRAGFADTRGTLFFDLARILRAKQPRLFVFENVKGLLSHDGGKTFRVIIAAIDELGYDCQWQVLNSKNHGVPQNRERVIIVGHLRGTARPQVFPIIGANSQNIKQVNDPVHSRNRIYAPDGIAPALSTMQGGSRQPKIITGSPAYVDGKRTMRYRLSDEAPTIRATQHKSGDNQPRVLQRARGKNKGGEHTIAPTITGKSYQDNNHLHEIDGTIRRLTPLECERLQAFPDNWTKIEVEQTSKVKRALGIKKYMSDSQRYKMCGNAVTTNVIQAVFERIMA